jgi:regulatory protein YycI of two-component signal transduction system YycFG
MGYYSSMKRNEVQIYAPKWTIRTNNTKTVHYDPPYARYLEQENA